MPSPAVRKMVALLLLFCSCSGCALYEQYGYGKVVNSKLDASIATPVQLPANAPTISQRFRPTRQSAFGEHRGFDLMLPVGTPVLAANAGVVASIEWSVLYGRQLKINHDKGAGDFALQTRYFHLDEILVAEQQRLKRGQLVGYSGISGLASGGFPHLHFEVHRIGDGNPPRAVRYLDPQLFWVDGVGRITCFDRDRRYADSDGLTYPAPCRDIPWQLP